MNGTERNEKGDEGRERKEISIITVGVLSVVLTVPEGNLVVRVGQGSCDRGVLFVPRRPLRQV